LIVQIVVKACVVGASEGRGTSIDAGGRQNDCLPVDTDTLVTVTLGIGVLEAIFGATVSRGFTARIAEATVRISIGIHAQAFGNNRQSFVALVTQNEVAQGGGEVNTTARVAHHFVVCAARAIEFTLKIARADRVVVTAGAARKGVARGTNFIEISAAITVEGAISVTVTPGTSLQWDGVIGAQHLTTHVGA
jgi:hypothetical protein